MSLLCDMSLLPFFGLSQSTFNQGFSGLYASVHFTECGFSFTLYLNNRFYISLHLCAFSLTCLISNYIVDIRMITPFFRFRIFTYLGRF